jgi:hypothetical protein
MWSGIMIFNRMAPDGAFYAALMEKAFAKVNGNYEFINYGWQSESNHVLTGAPSNLYSVSGTSAATLWTTVSTALAAGYMVGVDTGSSTIYSIPTSHAFNIMGAYQLKDTSGNVVNTLYRIRSPWGYDEFTGPFADGSSYWTTAYKAQVPYVNNVNDGAFFIQASDFLYAF